MTDAYARRNDPESSHNAAFRIRISKLEDAVYMTLKARRIWMTALEIARDMGIHPWSVSPRLKPLYEKGLIEQSWKVGVNTAGRDVKMLAWRVKPGLAVEIEIGPKLRAKKAVAQDAVAVAG